MSDIRQSSGYVAALAAMLAIATPFAATREGTELKPYRDVVGVWTVCSGETKYIDFSKTYTKEECGAMLQKRLAEFGGQVAQLSPAIVDSRFEWAAHSVFAYNVGTPTYSKSSIRVAFNAGDRVQACRNMRKYKYAGGQVITGLVYRREGHLQQIGEYELCLAGAVPFQLTGRNV